MLKFLAINVGKTNIRYSSYVNKETKFWYNGVDCVVHKYHKDACEAMGLLSNDGEYISGLKGASHGDLRVFTSLFHNHVIITQHVEA